MYTVLQTASTIHSALWERQAADSSSLWLVPTMSNQRESRQTNGSLSTSEQYSTPLLFDGYIDLYYPMYWLLSQDVTSVLYT